MKECITSLPVEMSPPNVYVKPNSDGQPWIESIMTPAGHITGPHIDHCGNGSGVLEVLGVKVVFSWAPNPNNLRWMAQRHMVTRVKDLLEGREDMTKLTVSVLFPGEGVRIDPAMPHAVISINNSAVTGWDYFDSNWIDDTIELYVLWHFPHPPALIASCRLYHLFHPSDSPPAKNSITDRRPPPSAHPILSHRLVYIPSPPPFLMSGRGRTLNKSLISCD